jgi:hypothetical protein
MALLVAFAVILSIAVALTLVYYLVRVIVALRSITAKLAAASQTEPAGELIGGIGSNVSSLDELVTGVARGLGIPVGAAR